MHETCEEVGLPTESEKDKWPTTTISFLDMELDTVGLEIHLTVKIYTRRMQDSLSPSSLASLSSEISAANLFC